MIVHVYYYTPYDSTHLITHDIRLQKCQTICLIYVVNTYFLLSTLAKELAFFLMVSDDQKPSGVWYRRACSWRRDDNIWCIYEVFASSMQEGDKFVGETHKPYQARAQQEVSEETTARGKESTRTVARHDDSSRWIRLWNWTSSSRVASTQRLSSRWIIFGDCAGVMSDWQVFLGTWWRTPGLVSFWVHYLWWRWCSRFLSKSDAGNPSRSWENLSQWHRSIRKATKTNWLSRLSRHSQHKHGEPHGALLLGFVKVSEKRITQNEALG